VKIIAVSNNAMHDWQNSAINAPGCVLASETVAENDKLQSEALKAASAAVAAASVDM